MFTVTEPLVLLDYFRVPIERAEPARGLASETQHPDGGSLLASVRPNVDLSKALYWVPARGDVNGHVSGAFTTDGVPTFCRMLPDEAARTSLESLGGKWHRSRPVLDPRGKWVASIWTESDGSIFLPFDPNEVIERYLSERYAEFIGSGLARAMRSSARWTYYRLRPGIPHGTRMVARRWFSRLQSRTSFPGWPVETALHDFYAILFDLLAELAGEPIPIISPWPQGYEWALVLTHDVETASGYDNIAVLRDIEARSSYRSSWNFVPRNHHMVNDEIFQQLRDEGFEIGVHGLHHDGRDISELNARLPLIRKYAEEWGAAGFRSPATLRDWTSMALLGFDYDSTYSDTAPYEPQPGGCCSWLPYMIDDLVELPITVPQDHTLFEILGGLDESLWLEKVRFLKARGGMALVLTHPDYAENERLVEAYTKLLEEFADDSTAWKTLPCEVSQWWRRRAASVIEHENDGWHVTGPAAGEATVTFIGADSRPR